MMEASDDEVSHSGSEEEESDDDETPVTEARKDAIYNVIGLHEKLEDMGWPDGIDWMHSLSLDYNHEGPPVDVNDDLGREMSFYTQGLEAAREAYLTFQARGVPFLRPADYYAEMIKSDTHMLKVKDKLLFQKKMMEESEERRKQREAKKFGKEVQAEKLKERAKQKKHDIESVKKWRKGRNDSDYADGEDQFDPDAERPGKKQKISASPWDRSGGKGRGGDEISSRGRGGGRGGGRGRGRGGGRGGSRDFKDKKFGNGGRKGMMKRNTAESTADEGSFKASFKGKSMGGRGGGRGRGGGGRGGGRGRGAGRSRGRG
jgi:rRNA-processing protein EBP2